MTGVTKAAGPTPARDLRAEFDLDPKVIHLDAATLGPLPRRARRLLGRADQDYARRPRDPYPHTALSGVRAGLAADLGGAPDELVLTPNATAAHATVLAGLRLPAGAEILSTTHECFTVRGPQAACADATGVRVVRIDPPVGPDQSAEEIVARFAAAITPATRVLQWPAVSLTVGATFPTAELAALAARHGLVSMVDASLGVGQDATPLDELGVDFVCAALSRYQCGPLGTGLLWLRNRVRPGRPPLPDFAPPGALDHPLEGGLPPRATGAEPGYDLGTLLQSSDSADLSRAEALLATCGLWRDIGRDAVQVRLAQLGDHLRAAVVDRWGRESVLGPVTDARLHSPVVAFDPTAGTGGSNGSNGSDWPWFTDLAAALHADGVQVAPTATPAPAGGRPGTGLRLSPHLYNTPAEIDHALAAISRQVAAR